MYDNIDPSDWQEHVTVDSHVVRIYVGDGRKKDIITPEEKMTRLLHTGAPMDLYLGWNVGSSEIFVCDICLSP